MSNDASCPRCGRTRQRCLIASTRLWVMDPQGIDTGGVKLGGKIRVKLTRNRSLVPTPWWKFWSRLFGRYIEAMECVVKK
jgi:hypothetical protein